MAFPINPVEGDLYTDKKGVTFVFTDGGWVLHATGSIMAGGDTAKVAVNNQTVSGNAGQNIVTFNPTLSQVFGSGITVNAQNITLGAGRWRVSASLGFSGFNGGTVANIQQYWREVGTTTPIGSTANTASNANTGNDALNTIIEFVVELTAPKSYELFCVGSNGAATLGTQFSSVIVERVSNSVVGGFTGANSGVAGGVGLVPAPSAGQQNHRLSGDGTWVTDYIAFSRPGNQMTNGQTAESSYVGGSRMGGLSVSWSSGAFPSHLAIKNDGANGTGSVSIDYQSIKISGTNLFAQVGSVDLNLNGAAAVGTLTLDSANSSITYNLVQRSPQNNTRKKWRVTMTRDATGDGNHIVFEYFAPTTL